MKKLFFIMMAAAALMISCEKKDADLMNVIEGQWVTDEIPAEDFTPTYKFLLDIGVESGADKLTMAMLMTGSNEIFKKGDLALVSKSVYTYDATTGILEASGDKMTVTFLSESKIKLTFDGMDFLFIRANRHYSFSGIKPFEEFFEVEKQLTLTADVIQDWAGGSILLHANFDITSTTLLTSMDLTPSEKCISEIIEENGVYRVKLGLYHDAEGKISNCEITIKAYDEKGAEASCTVYSDGWEPAFYSEIDGEWVEGNPVDGWTRGTECWLGVKCVGGEVATSDNNTYSGIEYSVPLFMNSFGTKENKHGFDAPYSNETGTITFTYGDLTYEYEIDII